MFELEQEKERVLLVGVSVEMIRRNRWTSWRSLR